MDEIMFEDDLLDSMEIVSFTESCLEESVKSNIDEGYKSKERLTLSKFNRTELNDVSIKKYKGQCSSLRHIRTGRDYKGFLYVDKGNIVAFINVDTGRHTIQAIEVMNKYKGHKLSEQLLSVCINELRADNLSVNKNNNIAIYLYKKNRFTVYKEDDTMLYMKLPRSNILEECFEDYINYDELLYL